MTLHEKVNARTPGDARDHLRSPEQKFTVSACGWRYAAARI